METVTKNKSNAPDFYHKERSLAESSNFKGACQECKSTPTLTKGAAIQTRAIQSKVIESLHTANAEPEG